MSGTDYQEITPESSEASRVGDFAKLELANGFTFCKILDSGMLSQVLAALQSDKPPIHVWVAHCWSNSDGQRHYSGNYESRMKKASKFKDARFILEFSKAAAQLHGLGADDEELEKND